MRSRIFFKVSSAPPKFFCWLRLWAAVPLRLLGPPLPSPAAARRGSASLGLRALPCRRPREICLAGPPPLLSFPSLLRLFPHSPCHCTTAPPPPPPCPPWPPPRAAPASRPHPRSASSPPVQPSSDSLMLPPAVVVRYSAAPPQVAAPGLTRPLRSRGGVRLSWPRALRPASSPSKAQG